MYKTFSGHRTEYHDDRVDVKIVGYLTTYVTDDHVDPVRVYRNAHPVEAHLGCMFGVVRRVSVDKLHPWSASARLHLIYSDLMNEGRFAHGLLTEDNHIGRRLYCEIHRQ